MLSGLARTSQADLPLNRVKSSYTTKTPQRIMAITEKQAREAVTLAARLKLALATRGIKGVDLARAIKVKRQAVYYWLDGTTKSIDSDNLHRAASFLGVRAGWLQNGEQPIYETPPMGEEEIQLVGFFQKMDDAQRRNFMDIAEALAVKEKTPATTAPPYRVKVPLSGGRRGS